MVYKLTDLESGQCAEGTATALSALLGIGKSMIRYLANEECIYQKRYYIQKLQREGNKISLWQQWDEIHEIYLELREGEREIQKAADGKRYAVIVSKKRGERNAEYLYQKARNKCS